VLHVFSTFEVGGAQMRFTAIANRFGPAWHHAIIAMDGNHAARSRLAPDVDASFPPVHIRKGDTLANVRSFRRALRDIRPDVLVTYNWGATEWALANALKLVRHVHVEDGFGPEEQSRQLPRRVWLRGLFLRRSTVVVPSRTLHRIATKVWRLPPGRVRYLPNGIDLDRYRVTPGDAIPAWPGEGPVIGTVATLRAEKNLPRLLRATHLLTQRLQARLVIVGEGPERPALQVLAGELGIADRVHFTGYCSTPQDMYRGFDVFALTSDTEQMPLSVLEAMAAGLPVASTDVGDVRGMLAEPNRAFVVPRDDAALANAMEQLLRQPDLRREIGAANRAKAEREYDQEAMFRAHAALFDGTT
jgi:glycosyltransferase involved in cell wall biosynthesis